MQNEATLFQLVDRERLYLYTLLLNQRADASINNLGYIHILLYLCKASKGRAYKGRLLLVDPQNPENLEFTP